MNQPPALSPLSCPNQANQRLCPTFSCRQLRGPCDPRQPTSTQHPQDNILQLIIVRHSSTTVFQLVRRANELREPYLLFRDELVKCGLLLQGQTSNHGVLEGVIRCRLSDCQLSEVSVVVQVRGPPALLLPLSIRSVESRLPRQSLPFAIRTTSARRHKQHTVACAAEGHVYTCGTVP